MRSAKAEISRRERIGWLAGQDYAHRGLHGPGVPENSMAALAAAIAAGLGIGCDVRVSACGQAMVFHDRTLSRLAGRGEALSSLDREALSRCRLLGTGEAIPSLADLLDLVAGTTPVLIELKSERDSLTRQLCEAVARDMASRPGPAAIMSFDPRVPRWFSRYAPDISRGLVVTEQGRRGVTGLAAREAAALAARPDFLAYDIRDLPSPFAMRRRSKGVPVLTWTVLSQRLLARAREHADAAILEGEGYAVRKAAQA